MPTPVVSTAALPADAQPAEPAPAATAPAAEGAAARPRRGSALPDLRALEAFVSVIDAGSMALAAQRLGLSQSAVSQAVRALEQAHG
ncbi:MAG: LysR family transcriptional regulator, partial [Leptothrix sp. (in: b-proteobacteria)]